MGVNSHELLQLISGEPIYSSLVKLRPKTVGEILTNGEIIHSIQLYSLTKSVSAFLEEIKNTDEAYYGQLRMRRKELSSLGLHAVYSLNEEYRMNFISSFSYFTEIHPSRIIFNSSHDFTDSNINILRRESDGAKDLETEVTQKEINDKNSQFTGFVITPEHFDLIVDILKIQNVSENILSDNAKSEAEIVPHDDKVRDLMKRMEENRAKIQKAKYGDSAISEDVLSLGEIVSIVTTRSKSIGKHNFKELTLFQLFDELHRLTLYEKYDIIMKARMAGAEIKDDEEQPYWSDNLYRIEKK